MIIGYRLSGEDVLIWDAEGREGVELALNSLFLLQLPFDSEESTESWDH